MLLRSYSALSSSRSGAGVAISQDPPRLTLQDAVAIAVKNHPQIQAAQNEANFAHQQIIMNRAPYYPSVNADITCHRRTISRESVRGSSPHRGCSTASDKARL